jgi:hypothetical protein
MIEQMLSDLHWKILDLRAVKLTVSKPHFHRLFEASPDTERQRVREMVLKGDKSALKMWMRDHPDIDLGEMSLNHLKRIGKSLGIHNYSRLDRNILTQRIEEKRAKSKG